MHTLRFLIFLWVLIALSFSVQGENLPNIDFITSDDGLSHNTVRCMLQDTTGFLWFGSLNGLNRYDGVKIKTLIPETNNINSLSSGKIKELYKDSRGYIWIRTYSDIIHCYNPYTENFLAVFDSNEERYERHNQYYEDNEKNIWLGSTSSGCVRISFGEKKISTLHFNTRSSKLNLPSDDVNDIFEDSRNVVWILTNKGLRLFKDGKLTAIAEKRIKNTEYIKVYETNQKIYLISAQGRLDVFDLKLSQFVASYQIPVSINVFRTSLLGSDKILISGYSGGVFLFNTQNGKFLNSTVFAGDIIGGNVYFQTDEMKNVWMYNFTGNVWLIQPNGNGVKKLNLIPPTILSLIDEERFQFQTDKIGNVWITTYGNGLFYYQPTSGELTHYIYQKNSLGISSNYLLSIVLDRNDNIWVGTENMGVNKLSFVNRNVHIVFTDPEHKVKNGNVVRSLFEDSKGYIWVGTKSGSLYKYDSNFTNKKVIFENGHNVYTILEGRDGTIWLGTRGNGLFQYADNKLSQPAFCSQFYRKGLTSNGVFSLLSDHKGRIWTATFGGGVNVKLANNDTTCFRTFFNNDEWVRFTRYIYEDNSGDIWVATSNGVIRFQPDSLLSDSSNYKYYNFDPEIERSLSNPEVRYIFQDSKNNIWLATAGGGVNRFVGETASGNGIFDVYRNQQGIANDNIMAVLEDDEGLLWVGTESGLHAFNPQTRLFRYFKFSNDFSSNVFSESTALKCRDGRMVWASLNGLYVFRPSDLTVRYKSAEKVVLTGFFIYDEEALIGDKKAPLTKSVSYSDKITLNASDKVFHIEFSSLNFRDPKSNQFMFILDDFEKRWNNSGTYNVATYRNVPPGKYLFRVKTLNTEGAWSDEETTLEIIIRPPLWASLPAYLIYLLLIAALVFFAIRLALKFNRLNNTVKVERQLIDYKLRFFTNISHEFRTPLTLIKGSVDTLNEIKQKMSAPLQQLVLDLDKNTTHMMRLIEQLLEFRKLQNNKQKLNLQKTDAVEFLKDIYENFENVAQKMNIEYRFVTSSENIELFLDKSKVDKVVFNLLSNAFKFTPRGGMITFIVDLDNKNGNLQISVADTGIGIPKDKQNLLFSRFMQINFSASGTGIGLSLVNEFTALHKGSVSFAENEGGGSVFTVSLPIGVEKYGSDDFVSDQIIKGSTFTGEVYKISEFIQPENENSALTLLAHEPIAGKKYKILVIDDNDDIREFLSDKLNPYFDIVTAIDGNDGMEKSMNEDLDLIICDVMMPGMNGFELTKTLKDNFATCHIPVVLLTAYISDEHHTEGVVAGADAYISKPFSMKHLLLQINKLLEKRERLHKHYSGNEPSELNVNLENESDRLPEKDIQFMKLVEELLEQHLSNPDFAVDDFAAMTNTGRTLFFKKIKSLTGYSPNEFIRYRRLSKAAELLKTYKYNVSEVSYMVGINDPFYFSKCFKTQFGCSPSKYLNS